MLVTAHRARTGLALLLGVIALAIAVLARASDDAFADATPAITIANRERVRLVIAGDTDGSATLRAAIARVQREKPIDGIVLTGDNIYDCGVVSVDDRQWRGYIQNYSSLGVPIYPVLGNHDYGNPKFADDGRLRQECSGTSPSAQIEASGRVPGWTFPARNYVIATRFADLFMTDTQPISMNAQRSYRGSATVNEQRQWLDRLLQQSQARWKIVVGHHVIESSGGYGTKRTESQQRMRALLPIFAKRDVTLYVAGHDHHLELLGELPRKKREPLFLVSGAGDRRRVRPHGARQHPPRSLFLPPQRTSGFALLEIARDELRISFYDAAGRKISRDFVVQ